EGRVILSHATRPKLNGLPPRTFSIACQASVGASKFKRMAYEHVFVFGFIRIIPMPELSLIVSLLRYKRAKRESIPRRNSLEEQKQTKSNSRYNGNIEKAKEDEHPNRPNKSMFKMEEGKFLRYIITMEGIRAVSKKMQEIVRSPTPKDPDQIRSLSLKLTTISKFITKLAELMNPIREVRKALDEKNRSIGSLLDLCPGLFLVHSSACSRILGMCSMSINHKGRYVSPENPTNEALHLLSLDQTFCFSGIHIKGSGSRKLMPSMAKISFGVVMSGVKLNDKIPKMGDEMFERVRAFIRGEMAVGSAKMVRPLQGDKGNTSLVWFGGQEKARNKNGQKE
nr:hypothetical protein [Tanacetum cinerariifolium]